MIPGSRTAAPSVSARAQAAAAWTALYLRWKKRFQSWIAFLAKFWAVYWLLIIGSSLVLGSAVFKWVEYPLSSNLSGIKLPLFNSSGIIPHASLLSFGVLAVVIL